MTPPADVFRLIAVNEPANFLSCNAIASFALRIVEHGLTILVRNHTQVREGDPEPVKDRPANPFYAWLRSERVLL